MNGAEFLEGGGHLGARIRAHDWAHTPLGDPAGWPQSLKTILRMMLHSRFAMWMAWGPDGTFFCNDAYLPTVGIKRDWVLGARADTVWAEIWGDIGPRIAHVLTTGEATWDEALQLFLERSGYAEETFHTFSYSPVHDDAGAVAGMLCVVAEDTDRVIGERRLQLLRDLAALPTDHAASVDEAGMPLIALLAGGVQDVPFASLYLADESGAGARHVASTSAAVAAVVPAHVSLDDAASPWPIAAAMRNAEACEIADFAARCGALRGAWAEPVQQALVLPLAGSAQAAPIGALVLGVSTRRRLDERYRSFLWLVAGQVSSRLADAQARLAERRRAEALAELDRAKSAFFSNVSHEFRTPLTLMLGPIDALLEDAGPLPENQRGALELVRRNGLRLRKLVNSLLDFSRIEAGRLETNLRRTDLAALTRDIASVFRSAIEQAGLRYVVTCDDLPEAAWVDQEMWEKIVLNLLSNALKFTFEGEIEIHLGLAGDDFELTVRDTGVGISPDAVPLVFDRFHRIQGGRSRSQEGTGIGLALVKELIRLQGGSIAVESEPDRGSVFTVRLPRDANRPSAGGGEAGFDAAAERLVDAKPFLDDALRAGAEPAAGDAAPRPPGRARVLVVDDNADMRAYLQRLLIDRWDVVTAGDGRQALERLDRVDVVITDVMMPLLDGFGLVERLRADPATQSLPIIVLSAQAGEEARVRGLSRGADDYLVKPFSARELAARVEVQLMRARLRGAEEALNSRLADVFRHAPVGMALLGGAAHTFEFANAHYRALVGGRDVRGREIRAALPELEGQGIYELLDGVRQSGEPYIGRAFPVALQDPAGGFSRRWFDFVFQPLQRAEGISDGIAVVCFDVTELMAAREQAESASRAKDEFIAMLGHELRNPLAPMLTALQLMKMQWPDAAVRERDMIDRQLRHMVRLLDDLLDVARIARGSVELKKAEVELAAVIGRAVEIASPLFEKRGVALDIDVAASGLMIDADVVRLSQVVGNLLNNAAKFSEAGETVALAARRDGDGLVVTVRDRGIGMTPAEIETIFGIFVQGRQALHRPRGGLGLGLAIARSLAGLHGGTLSAESAGPGRGSTFTLQLPALAPTRGARSEAPPQDRDVDGAGRRILVVDDNVDAAESLADLLDIWGFEATVVHDGPAALDALAQRSADIALLDIGLPVMDGYELAQRIRATEAGRAMRLVALTGYGQASDRRRSREFGFDAHLVKPVDAEQLATALGPPPDL